MATYEIIGDVDIPNPANLVYGYKTIEKAKDNWILVITIIFLILTIIGLVVKYGNKNNTSK